jgi:F0F1-type ATP synthase membrane subunit c/vacuolar-type H+-ATPase subunit K
METLETFNERSDVLFYMFLAVGLVLLFSGLAYFTPDDIGIPGSKKGLATGLLGFACGIPFGYLITMFVLRKQH